MPHSGQCALIWATPPAAAERREAAASIGRLDERLEGRRFGGKARGSTAETKRSVTERSRYCGVSQACFRSEYARNTRAAVIVDRSIPKQSMVLVPWACNYPAG